MATFVFKLGRWTLIGTLGIASAAACGGRGNLRNGGDDGDGGDDTTGFGGTASSFGGATSFAGKVSGGATGIAGSSVGGTNSGGGSSGVGGSGLAGTGGGKGCGLGPPCAAPYRCVSGTCTLNRVCKPSEQQCDPSSQLVVRCLPDGSGYRAVENCQADGLICSNGVCRNLICAPGSVFCDGYELRACSGNGLDSFLLQSCVNGLYCDSASQSCQPLCNPNTADCNGADDGCETNIVVDPDNCGGCAVSCSSNHMATRACNGTCSGVCQAGYDDCNGDKLHDGCETRIDNNATSCGSCGVQCSTNHVAAHCSDGSCDGACHANFADCNDDKQFDGCESDSRSDVNNCGACGVRCSSNHITRACNQGTCEGTCKAGWADCNGDKQSDGCETSIMSDPLHCGGCNEPCAEGGCSNGVCSSLFTFSGIKQNLPAASLVGWTECHSDLYGGQASLDEIFEACAGSQLLLACRKAGSNVLLLAAHAPFEEVTFDTGGGDLVHEANGVGWYFSQAESWGFAPEGATVRRFTCDIEDSTLQRDGEHGDKRLCWHTSGGFLSSGWRCGATDSLNDDSSYERVIFAAP